MCAKGLSTLLNRAETTNGISWLPIIRGATKLKHSFLYIITLPVFCKANLSEWQKIQEISKVYKGASR
jgi:hypothetical protein